MNKFKQHNHFNNKKEHCLQIWFYFQAFYWPKIPLKWYQKYKNVVIKMRIKTRTQPMNWYTFSINALLFIIWSVNFHQQCVPISLWPCPHQHLCNWICLWLKISMGPKMRSLFFISRSNRHCIGACACVFFFVVRKVHCIAAR